MSHIRQAPARGRSSRPPARARNDTLVLAAAMALATAFASGDAFADRTATLPAGAFALDLAWTNSTSRQGWTSDREKMPLLNGIRRYEPGGGWQGDIEAEPSVVYNFLITQLMYGVTENLTAALAVPLVLDATIDTNLSWRSGDYMSQLGRPYSESDFWQWAESMGQPKPTDRWEGNHNSLADMVLALRYRLPRLSWMERWGVDVAVAAQAALPTGSTPDPEQLVVAGTTAWDLHSYADLQLHLSVEKSWYDAHGVPWLALGVDTFYGWMRSREFTTPTGTLNPLLLNYQPYVGDTYQIDGGDWLSALALVDWSPWAGPTYATYVTKGDMARAQELPRLLTLQLAFQYLKTAQSDWISDSEIWNWQSGREEFWQPGDKNTVIAQATVSLLRVGAPLQLYVRYRNQELVPGRNTRAANALFLGMRLLAKL